MSNCMLYLMEEPVLRVVATSNLNICVISHEENCGKIRSNAVLEIEISVPSFHILLSRSLCVILRITVYDYVFFQRD